MLQRQRIAVVGSGIAGLVAARRLDARHDVVLFEAGARPGGHTRTLAVDHEDRRLAVDIGFIVFNDVTYPNFIAMLDEFEIVTRPTRMSFSVRDDGTGLEYQGSGLNGLFAQRRNLLRPRFYRLLADIRRFFTDGKAMIDAIDTDLTLGAFLTERSYGGDFIDRFIVPMGAAIWSSDPERMLSFPAATFLRFFNNHGLLDYRDRPQWRVLDGGSRTYVDRLLAEFRGEVRTSTPVRRVARQTGGVFLQTAAPKSERFDYVVLACHSDQALAMLADASATETRVLRAIPYQDNDVVLHTDTTLLPRRRRAWAAWNYHLSGRRQDKATLTYNMNILQGLDSDVPLCVTLNSDDLVDRRQVLHRTTMSHPVFTTEGIAAQEEIANLNGQRRTAFCGAWCRYGFHEDGVVSAMAAADAIEACIADEELPLQRAN